ncbi:MAG TPA: M23 family metallopeptidase [Thermoleophilaceae bacterium]|jgi:murein DD-endopeptidase MepM/ murein hydrolase activator NlpD
MALRRSFLVAVLAAAALAASAVPAFAVTSGGATAPSAASLSGDTAGEVSGGASPADALAAAARDRAEAERAQARARKLAKRRAKARARARARAKARAKAKRRRRRAAAATPPTPVAPSSGSFFPIAGPHTYGDAGARFGAGRTGHIHQGQDVMAAEGTPLVSPVKGTIRLIGDQPSGAGVYVVIHDADGVHEYALMHIQTGSLQVHAGDSVSPGDRIASVGHTGAAEGPHLHFEEWVGPWQTGGHPIDPLPLLQSWDTAGS